MVTPGHHASRKPATKLTPLQRKAVAMARACARVLKKQPMGTSGIKIRAYYTLGRFLKAASPNRSQTYEEEVLKCFVRKWAQLRCFQLSLTGAKYCRMFATAFANPALRKQALEAGLTWTRLRILSGKNVTPSDRRAAVSRALIAKKRGTAP